MTTHEVTVTIRADEYAGQPFTDDDLFAAVRSALHEVSPTTSDYPVVPEVYLGNPDLDDEPWVDQVLTLSEAAARLGVAASTLRGQIANGKLRGRLVGKTWTVSEREVERYRSESLGKPGRKPHDSASASR